MESPGERKTDMRSKLRFIRVAERWWCGGARDKPGERPAPSMAVGAAGYEKHSRVAPETVRT